MPTRIVRRGDEWVIEGDTLEQLEVGIAAVDRALSRNGGESKSPPAAKRPRGRPPNPERGAATSGRFRRDHDKALAFLRTIRDAGPAGVDGAALVKVLDLKSGKALGNPVSKINEVIAEAGFERAAVYHSVRKPGENKRWYPREKIEDAIKKIAANDAGE